jgi:phenol/toluene 2-monooxygenase (NADH) P4/A4
MAATTMGVASRGVKAIGAYDFRSPKAMSWGDFWHALAVPFLEEDPDFDPNHPFVFAVEGRPFTPDPAASLESQGITHKCVISMSSN